jgi:MFS family permease
MNIRNVAILSVSQALALCGGSMVILLGGIIGSAMAPNPALATLPMAMMVVGIALFAVPAALLMKRIGRKRGFILAMATGTLAALGAAYAVTAANYLLFCAAALFIGGNFAFAQQYRFAAAESADRQHAGRAVAFVLLGGVVAGILGPQVARLASGWLPVTYAGSFLALAGLYAAGTVTLLFFRNPPAQAETKAEPERHLRAIVTQPGYLAAMWAGLAAYGVMGFIMTS